MMKHRVQFKNEPQVKLFNFEIIIEIGFIDLGIITEEES